MGKVKEAIKRTFWWNSGVATDTPQKTGPYSKPQEQTHIICHVDDANLVSSLTDKGLHAPVIDLDFPIMAVPSSTEGHFHLYIEKELTWNQYKRLLDGFKNSGLIQAGWYQNAVNKKASYVRPPWVEKGDDKTKQQPKELRGLLSKPSNTEAWKAADDANLPEHVYWNGPKLPIERIEEHGLIDADGWFWPDEAAVFFDFFVGKYTGYTSTNDSPWLVKETEGTIIKNKAWQLPTDKELMFFNHDHSVYATTMHYSDGSTEKISFEVFTAHSVKIQNVTAEWKQKNKAIKKKPTAKKKVKPVKPDLFEDAFFSKDTDDVVPWLTEVSYDDLNGGL